MLACHSRNIQNKSWSLTLPPSTKGGCASSMHSSLRYPIWEVGLAELRSATQLPTPRSSTLCRRYTVTVYSWRVSPHRVLRQLMLSLKACAINFFFGIWASCRVAVQVLRSRAKTVGRCRVRRRRARRMLTVDIRVCRSRHSQATHAIMMA